MQCPLAGETVPIWKTGRNLKARPKRGPKPREAGPGSAEGAQVEKASGGQVGCAKAASPRSPPGPGTEGSSARTPTFRVSLRNPLPTCYMSAERASPVAAFLRSKAAGRAMVCGGHTCTERWGTPEGFRKAPPVVSAASIIIRWR